jgi:hypothetical protein
VLVLLHLLLIWSRCGVCCCCNLLTLYCCHSWFAVVVLVLQNWCCWTGIVVVSWTGVVVFLCVLVFVVVAICWPSVDVIHDFLLLNWCCWTGVVELVLLNWCCWTGVVVVSRTGVVVVFVYCRLSYWCWVVVVLCSMCVLIHAVVVCCWLLLNVVLTVVVCRTCVSSNSVSPMLWAVATCLLRTLNIAVCVCVLLTLDSVCSLRDRERQREREKRRERRERETEPERDIERHRERETQGERQRQRERERERQNVCMCARCLVCACSPRSIVVFGVGVRFFLTRSVYVQAVRPGAVRANVVVSARARWWTRAQESAAPARPNTWSTTKSVNRTSAISAATRLSATACRVAFTVQQSTSRIWCQQELQSCFRALHMNTSSRRSCRALPLNQKQLSVAT